MSHADGNDFCDKSHCDYVREEDNGGPSASHRLHSAGDLPAVTPSIPLIPRGACLGCITSCLLEIFRGQRWVRLRFGNGMSNVDVIVLFGACETLPSLIYSLIRYMQWFGLLLTIVLYRVPQREELVIDQLDPNGRSFGSTFVELELPCRRGFRSSVHLLGC